MIIQLTDFKDIVPISMNANPQEVSIAVLNVEEQLTDSLNTSFYTLLKSLLLANYKAWSRTTPYVTGDYVFISNDAEKVLYKCLTGNTNDAPPSANWERVLVWDMWWNYLRKFAVWEAFASILVWHGHNFTDYGLSQISDDNTTPISSQERANKIAEAKRKANKYWNDFTRAMSDARYTLNDVNYPENSTTVRNDKKPYTDIFSYD